MLLAPLIPPSSEPVSDLSSLQHHVAAEVAERKHADGELWNAYSRLADCYQVMSLDVAQIKLTTNAIRNSQSNGTLTSLLSLAYLIVLLLMVYLISTVQR